MTKSQEDDIITIEEEPAKLWEESMRRLDAIRRKKKQEQADKPKDDKKSE